MCLLDSTRLYNSKEAYLLKQKGKEIWWITCPVCLSFGALIAKKEYCSIKCEQKVIEAKNWIEVNNYATIGSYVSHNNKRVSVYQTTLSKIQVARGCESFIYTLKDGNEYIRLSDLDVPLSKIQ